MAFQAKNELQVQVSTVPDVRPWLFAKLEQPMMQFSEVVFQLNFAEQLQTAFEPDARPVAYEIKLQFLMHSKAEDDQ